MPAHAKGPISHVILGADGKPDKSKSLTFQRGDYVSDEQLATMSGSHHHRLTTIPHNDFTCPSTCSHEFHSRHAAAALEAANAAQSDLPKVSK